MASDQESETSDDESSQPLLSQANLDKLVKAATDAAKHHYHNGERDMETLITLGMESIEHEIADVTQLEQIFEIMIHRYQDTFPKG